MSMLGHKAKCISYYGYGSYVLHTMGHNKKEILKATVLGRSYPSLGVGSGKAFEEMMFQLNYEE